MDLMRNIDVLGKQFNFNIEGSKFRTSLGGILSLLIFFGVLVLTWYFGKEIYQKANPNFIEKTTLLDYSPWFYNLNNSNFFLAYRLKFNETTIDDPSEAEHIFRFKEHLCNNITKTCNDTNSYFKPEKCTTNHIDNTTFVNNKLDQYYCINTTMYLGGPNKDESFTRPYLYVKFCDNETEQRYNVKCKARDILESKYKGQKLFVNFVYQSNLVSPTAFPQIYEKSFFMTESGLDMFNPLALYQWVYYRKAQMVSDVGFMFEELEYDDFVEFDSQVLTNEPPNEDFNKQFFFKLMIFMGRTYNIYRRIYIKVPQVLAAVGGFVNIALFAIKFIYEFYLENEFVIFIYEKMFNLTMEDTIGDGVNNDLNMKDEKKKVIELEKVEESALDFGNNNCSNYSGKQILPNKSEILGDSNISSSNRTRRSLYSSMMNKIENISGDIILNKEIHKLLKFKKKKRKPVSIDRCDRISLYYCCAEKRLDKATTLFKIKIELMRSADNIMSKRNEIFEVWKMIDQVRLIKKLILNESQCIMIGNKGRQLLCSEGTNLSPSQIEKLEEKENEEAKVTLIEYFKTRKKDKKISPVDMLLFNYCEPDLKNFINEQVEVEK